MDIGARLTSALNWLNPNLGESIKFSFSWLSRPDDRILFLKLFAVQLVSTIILVFMLALLVGATQLKGNFSLVLLSSGLLGVIAYVLVTILVMLVVAYFQPLAMLSAMKEKKLATVKWGFDKFLGSIMLAILEQITVLLFWFNRKWLVLYVPLIIALALLVAYIFVPNDGFRAIASAIAMVLIIISSIPLAVMLTYTKLKLSLCLPAYLSKEGCGYMEALEGSWKLTEGRVLELFSIYFLFGILLTLLSLLLLPLSFGSALVEVVEKLIYGVGIVSTAIGQVLNVLFVLFSTFCTFGLTVALYGIVKKEKGTKGTAK